MAHPANLERSENEWNDWDGVQHLLGCFRLGEKVTDRPIMETGLRLRLTKTISRENVATAEPKGEAGDTNTIRFTLQRRRLLPRDLNRCKLLSLSPYLSSYT